MLFITILVFILLLLLLIPYKGEVGGLTALLLRKKPIWPVFWCLVVVFIVNLLGFIPAVAQLMTGPVYAFIFALFLLFGIVLVVIIVRSEIGGLLKKSLMLTGIAPVGMVISFFLGEAISELLPSAAIVADIIIYLFMAAFVAGAISSVLLARKQAS